MHILPKKKVVFTIHPDVFIKLKVFAAKRLMPYSIILEALADAYVDDPNSFPTLNFDKYK